VAIYRNMNAGPIALDLGNGQALSVGGKSKFSVDKATENSGRFLQLKNTGQVVLVQADPEPQAVKAPPPAPPKAPTPPPAPEPPVSDSPGQKDPDQALSDAQDSEPKDPEPEPEDDKSKDSGEPEHKPGEGKKKSKSKRKSRLGR